MAVKLYDRDNDPKTIERIVALLESGGVIIAPTDTLYAICCHGLKERAIERICRLKGIDPKKQHLSIICYDISTVTHYAKIENAVFKLMKRNLPGPFTFVLTASSRVPDKALEKRRTIGVRIPANGVARAIVERLGAPLITASVKDDDEVVEYTTDPELIHERYGREVDLVIDGGTGDNVPTTVVDLTQGEAEVLREGKGELQ